MKGSWLQIRVREDIKDDVRVVAELRGMSMSALVHSLLIRAVRDEKAESPQAFIRGDIPTPLASDGVLKVDKPARKRAAK